MELIDRKALANEDPCEHCHYKGARCVYTCGENGYAEHAIWRTIDDAPTIDAVPIIRCKDCKYWGNPLNWDGRIFGECEWLGWFVGENGYCMYGERKDDLSLETETSDNDEVEDGTD